MISRLTVLFLIFLSTSVAAHDLPIYNESDSLEKDTIAPQFPGGIGVFYEYLKTNIKFPIASRLKGVQGKVLVKFDVDSTGQVANIRIKKGLDKYTNQEALRIMSQSPKWMPGVIKGKKVSFLYTIPLSFLDTATFTGAAVIVNGNLLRNYKNINKLNLDNTPYHIISPAFSSALFGAKYNKKMLVFNDSSINLKGYSEAHFKNSFKLLQNIDTSKVQLNVSEKISSIDVWRNYLTSDSILSIFINPTPAYRTYDKNKLGAITLLTRAGYNRQKKTRDNLVKSIVDFRNGLVPLRNELILIDDYSYNGSWIFHRIDTNVIHTVLTLSGTEATNLFGSEYKNGIIYIYTRRYQSDRQIRDKHKLLTLISDYKQDGKVPGYFIFINNIQIHDFKKVSELPASDIKTVNIISKDEARSFFGNQEQSAIIYIHTSSSFIK